MYKLTKLCLKKNKNIKPLLLNFYSEIVNFNAKITQFQEKIFKILPIY